jgi:aspartyl-tRNA(Asn)/glutamyl-tRNA(Gln) amidotransferase subunit B
MSSSSKWEAVIGLEVHVQVRTRTKMFCGCVNQYGDAQNTHLCPVCLGLPGSLPVPNEEAIRKTILSGLMLGCQIAPVARFDRKNYFYPDMPKNYQISQYDDPLCAGGGVTLDPFLFPKEIQETEEAKAGRKIRLVRIHLEEDVAKSFHFEDRSGIDFNRAGTPLMEIVSEADLRTPGEAFSFLGSLRQILLAGNVSDADMEKGQMRCDVNVSVRPLGQKEYGTKVELKNLNSISGVRRALTYEMARQIAACEKGEAIAHETRRWDDEAGATFTMRTKEKAHDYRYFPEPDLLPVRTDQGLLESARTLVPELPSELQTRLIRDFGVTPYQASVLTADRILCGYYEKAAAGTKNKPLVANWILNDFLSTQPDPTATPVRPEYFGELADLVAGGAINSAQAKKVFTELMAHPTSPKDLVKKLGLEQISDTSALSAYCDEAIAANPRSVEDYKAGKMNAINALKGFVMKKSQGKANPAQVDEILRTKLSS